MNRPMLKAKDNQMYFVNSFNNSNQRILVVNDFKNLTNSKIKKPELILIIYVKLLYL